MIIWDLDYEPPFPNNNDIIFWNGRSKKTPHNYILSIIEKNPKYYRTLFNKLTNEEDELTREQLFLKYQQLVSQLNNYDDLKIKEAEYILGFTCIADGKGIRDGKVVDQKVATIFTGKSDLAGRLGDIPIIIELKTRPEIPEDSIEAQLYALGASKLMRSEKEIIVLHIYVSDNNASIKERRFGVSELESAQAKFEDISKKPASWIPFDALSPKHSVGEWCEFCEFKNTCIEFR